MEIVTPINGHNGKRRSEIVRADMRKVKILPQTGFWGSEFPQNSVIRDHLKNIRYLLIVLIIT